MSPKGAVAAIALAFLLLQLVLVDTLRFFEWDEATYISQLGHGWQVPLGAHRAWGIIVVAAPAALVTDSVLVVRLWLVVASVAGFWFAFRLWCRELRWGAPTAAALAASSWVSIFFASEVQPNFFVGIGVLVASALVVRHGRGPLLAREWLVMSGAVGFVFLLRPPDGVISVGMLAILWFIVRQPTRGVADALRLAGAIGVGAAVGFIPWVVEAMRLYGGVYERWSAASEYVRSGLQFHGLEYLALADGPMQGPDNSGMLPMAAVTWLLAVLALTLAGILGGDRANRRLAIALTISSAVLAAPYMFYVGSTTPRFLLPSYFLVCLVAGMGAVGLWMHRRVTRIGTTGVVVSLILIVGLIWNLTIAWGFSRAEGNRRSAAPEVGALIQRTSAGFGCTFASDFSFPVISLASGCEGRHLSNVEEVERQLRDHTSAHRFLLFAKDPGDPHLDPGWDRKEFQVSNGGTWFVYHIPPS
jgi:hypothetical protein